MTATLRLKLNELDKYRRLKGWKNDTDLARAMGYDAGNLSRVLAGKQTPGPKFIAALVAAFGGAVDIADLFEVISEDGKAAA